MTGDCHRAKAMRDIHLDTVWKCMSERMKIFRGSSDSNVEIGCVKNLFFFLLFFSYYLAIIYLLLSSSSFVFFDKGCKNNSKYDEIVYGV